MSTNDKPRSVSAKTTKFVALLAAFLVLPSTIDAADGAAPGQETMRLDGIRVAIIIADFFIRYPEDINVPVPEALLFYPAVGFVAEIAFHVLPLALLLFVLAPLIPPGRDCADSSAQVSLDSTT